MRPDSSGRAAEAAALTGRPRLAQHFLGALRSAAYALVLAALVVGPQAVAAQNAAQVAVFPVSIGAQSLRELAAALDPVLVSQLHELPQIQVATRPALDLSATQLAVDCVGETRDCLSAVARQSGVEGLVAPSLRMVGQETVVTLLYFDGRNGGEMQSVTRRYSGPAVERLALDDVPSMVRELFGIPEPAPEAPAPSGLDASFGADMEETPQSSAWPAVPVAITAAGIVLGGVGAAFGFASNASMDRYRNMDVIDSTQDPAVIERRANQANDEYDKAHTQAMLCTIGLGLGGAAVVTGVTLWIIQSGRSRERDAMSLSPHVGAGEFGLKLQGSWGASSGSR
jgi:hypothetical protein